LDAHPRNKHECSILAYNQSVVSTKIQIGFWGIPSTGATASSNASAVRLFGAMKKPICINTTAEPITGADDPHLPMAQLLEQLDLGQTRIVACLETITEQVSLNICVN
jgi:hypothetical protein